MSRGSSGLDILKESIIFATAVAVGVGAWIAIDKINGGKRMEAEHRKQQAILENELRRKEEDEQRRRREEDQLAQRMVEEARREQARKLEEEKDRQRKLQSERARKLDALKRRFEDITRVLDRCKIEYWRDAPEEEKKARKVAPCVYYCLVARRIDDEVSVVEMKFDPATNAVYSVLSSAADPRRIEKEEFNGMIKGRPYFVVREEAGRPADVLYLCLPEDKSGEVYPMIKSFEEFNPSKIELGSLYDRMRDKMPSRAPNFAYVIFLHENERKKGVPVCEVSFGEAVSYETMRLAVENELMKEKLKALPRRMKQAGPPKKAHGFANHSTMAKKSLSGKYTPGEFHGTTTSYRGPGWLGGYSGSGWVDSHYIRRGSDYYRPKMYTHWRELEHVKEQIRQEYAAKVRANQLQEDYRPIVISTEEIDKVIKKAAISFKVVE